MSSLITLSDPRSPAAEAFQSLRTNIEFSRLETALRSILVTCAGTERRTRATRWQTWQW